MPFDRRLVNALMPQAEIDLQPGGLAQVLKANMRVQLPAEQTEDGWFQNLPMARNALDSEAHLKSSPWAPVTPDYGVRGKMMTPEEYMTQMLMMPKKQDEYGVDPDYWMRLQKMFGGSE